MNKLLISMLALAPLTGCVTLPAVQYNFHRTTVASQVQSCTRLGEFMTDQHDTVQGNADGATFRNAIAHGFNVGLVTLRGNDTIDVVAYKCAVVPAYGAQS